MFSSIRKFVTTATKFGTTVIKFTTNKTINPISSNFKIKILIQNPSQLQIISHTHKKQNKTKQKKQKQKLG